MAVSNIHTYFSKKNIYTYIPWLDFDKTNL